MNPSDLQPIIDAVNRLGDAQKKGPWDYAATIAVVLTLGVLIWYTIETYLLRKAAQKQITETDKLLREAERQNEIAIQPILAMRINHKISAIVLENVGSGPAFNISIGDFESGETSIKFCVKNEIMKPGGVQRVRFKFNNEGLLDLDPFWDKLKQDELPQTIHIEVDCMGLDRSTYRYSFRCEWNAAEMTLLYDGMAAGT